MAKYTGPKCRLCRREGTKLFLKGGRCYSQQCPVERKGAVPPGQHGFGRRRLSDYGRQLREKQKVKRIYGILERQFKSYFKKALRVRKESGVVLLRFLELRLDNVIYRLGLVPSRSVARQIIRHGFALVDNKKVNIPSYQVKPGQIISLSGKALNIKPVKEFLKEKAEKPPKWLSRKAVVGKVNRFPEREEIKGSINEDLIVEFYSR